MLVRQLEGMQGTPYGDATASGAAGLPRGASVINDLPSSALSVATTGQEADFLSDVRNRPGQAGMVYEPNIKPTTGRRTPSQAKAQDRSRTSRQRSAAGRTKLDAENQRTRMNNANQDDIYAQMERQRMIDAMTRAGYTPFNEVMRSRQSPVYGS